MSKKSSPFLHSNNTVKMGKTYWTYSSWMHMHCKVNEGYIRPKSLKKLKTCIDLSVIIPWLLNKMVSYQGLRTNNMYLYSWTFFDLFKAFIYLYMWTLTKKWPKMRSAWYECATFNEKPSYKVTINWSVLCILKLNFKILKLCRK